MNPMRLVDGERLSHDGVSLRRIPSWELLPGLDKVLAFFSVLSLSLVFMSGDQSYLRAYYPIISN